MNTQQEMMQILQATNAYYTSPVERGWEPSGMTESVFARHNVTGMNYFFELNPETRVIKIESFHLDQPNKITIYTGTITLGGRLIAPDMILALHTLFSFNFASDATFVVEKNRAKLIPAAKAKRKFSIASDDSLAGKNQDVPEIVEALGSWNSALAQVRTQSKFSKFARRIVYPEFRFWRKY